MVSEFIKGLLTMREDCARVRDMLRHDRIRRADFRLDMGNGHPMRRLEVGCGLSFCRGLICRIY